MVRNGTEKSTSLARRQIDAMPYLVASPTLSEGARLAKIARTTLYNWMDDPDFRDRFESLRDSAAELAHAELSGLMFKGVLVLADAMDSPDADLRLRAARTTLYAGLRALDLKDLERRLDKLDDAFSLWQERQPRR
ncbi:MAG: hypothetical protein IH956_02715 [Chloroflexi bacterium]|nr:hypothetical protein [Chloroflexota bacterium]